MFNPLISIVIPVYNGSNYLRESIDSALKQTYKNIEIIVVNDGSTDNTEEIAKSYGDKIRYFSKVNGGVSSALNLALREMKGEYFSWLSHDDVYYNEKVQKQIEFISKIENKKVILYSDYEYINEKSQIICATVLNHEMLVKKPEYALFRSSINGNTLLIPKKAFDEYGFFDEKLKCTQDYAMWYEMMKTYSFVHIPEILIKYRIHGLQDTNKNPKFISEGDDLWIKMMIELPIERKNTLEGNEFGFYREMSRYLKNTPYRAAFEYSNEIMADLVAKKRNSSLIVSFISHSAELAGAERALLDTLDMAQQMGVLANVILPREGKIEKELIKRNIYYEIIDLPWWANVDVTEIDKNKSLINLNAIILAFKLKIFNPDIIFTSTSVINEGAIAAKILGIPHIWNISEFGKKEHGIDYMLKEDERMKFIGDYSDKIFFVSKAIKEYYEGKVDEKKMVIMPNIVRIEDRKNGKKYFSDNHEALRVVVLANITTGKGQKDAVLAVKELYLKNKRVDLIIAGTIDDKEYYRELQKIIEDFKLQQIIKFIGFIEDPINLIAQSDIVLVCSTNEGFGRVTIEGMLLKKPVIGANSGATPELILDGENGFLYEPGNYKELSEKIEHFWDHKEKMAKMGRNGYEFAINTFNRENYAKKIFEEFMDLKKNKNKDSITQTLFIIEKLEQIKSQFNKEEDIIKQLQNKIKSMENSKFWQIRNAYISLKNFFKK